MLRRGEAGLKDGCAQVSSVLGSALSQVRIRCSVEPVPNRRTGILWQTQADPRLVGKTDHNVGGVACILGLTNSHNQSP